jgi:hypothetical protein
MNELTANVSAVELARSPLWLVPLLPALLAPLGLAALALVEAPSLDGLRARMRAAGERLGVRDETVVVLAALVASALVLLVGGLELALAPAGRRALLAVGPAAFRAGSLDASLTCSLDPARAFFALVVLAVTARLAWLGSGPSASRAELLAPVFFASGLSAFVLADDLSVVLAGGQALAVGVLLSFWDSRVAGRATALAQLSVATLVGAVALLVWGLGGAWGPGESGPLSTLYLLDARPRFVAMTLGERAQQGAEAVATPDLPRVDPSSNAPIPGKRQRSDPRGQKMRDVAKTQAFLTMTSHPGAAVYAGVADQSQLKAAKPLAVSPFVRVPLPAGMRTLAIVPGGAATIAGDGNEVAGIESIELPTERELSLVATGPTLSLHELGQGLALTEPSGRKPGESLVAARVSLFGLTVPTLLGGMLLVATALLVAPLGWLSRAPRASGDARRLALSLASVTALVGIALAGRFAGVLELSRAGVWLGRLAMAAPALALVAAFTAHRASPAASERGATVHVPAPSSERTIVRDEPLREPREPRERRSATREAPSEPASKPAASVEAARPRATKKKGASAKKGQGKK